jgi:hypothetical protein
VVRIYRSLWMDGTASKACSMHLREDVNVILTPPSIFCMVNHLWHINLVVSERP